MGIIIIDSPLAVDLTLAGARLYGQFRHLDPVDPDDGIYPYATVCAALAAPVDALYDLVAGGEAPWSPAFDPDEAAAVLPDAFALALAPWLGQFAGITRRDELPIDGQYVRLRETSGSRRATVGAIEGAARQRLVGPDDTPATATVYVTERVGGNPYVYAVATLADETPDPAGTARDLEEQRPAGYRYTYTVIDLDAPTYDVLLATHASYTEVLADFATYDDVLADPSVT